MSYAESTRAPRTLTDAEQALVDSYFFDIRPSEDDRPFFFRTTYWSQLWSRPPELRGMVPLLEASLVGLLLVIGLLAVVLVLLPLAWFARRSSSSAAWLPRTVAYFSALGLAYMGVEVALMQKLGLFLGHPNLAVSVVLASLLVSSGVGSAWSTGIVRRLGGVRPVVYLLVVVLCGQWYAWGWLAEVVHAPVILRGALVLLVVAPADSPKEPSGG